MEINEAAESFIDEERIYSTMRHRTLGSMQDKYIQNKHLQDLVKLMVKV